MAVETTPAIAATLPGPPGRPITGNLNEFITDRLTYLRELARTYGDVVRMTMLGRDLVLLVHPDAIEEVLVTKKRHFIKARATRATGALMGNGLLISEGDFWRRQRRLAQPAFHRERIARYSHLMTGYGEQMLEHWQPGATLDVHDEMVKVTLAIAAKAFFNADVEGAASDVGRALETALHHFNWWGKSGFMIPLWVPFRANRELAAARRRMDALVYGIIADRRRTGDDPGDLLSMLLNARDDDGSGMSDVQLRDEVMTLLMAGHETTANAMTWTFMLLAQHPDIDARLAEELRTVLGGRTPALDDIARLPYTDMVIKESMRLYPPAWVLGYEATETVTIGGYPLAKGTGVLMSQWVTQRDARWFASPDEFRPERWADPAMKKLPTYAYFPFGGGERMCIGKPFALMEAVLLLATIAGRYRLTLLPGQDLVPEPSITIRPKSGLHMQLHAR